MRGKNGHFSRVFLYMKIWELPAPCSRLSALGSRLSALGSRLPALGSRLSALGSRLPAPGSRLPAPGSRLSAPKNTRKKAARVSGFILSSLQVYFFGKVSKHSPRMIIKARPATWARNSTISQTITAVLFMLAPQNPKNPFLLFLSPLILQSRFYHPRIAGQYHRH